MGRKERVKFPSPFPYNAQETKLPVNGKRIQVSIDDSTRQKTRTPATNVARAPSSTITDKQSVWVALSEKHNRNANLKATQVISAIHQRGLTSPTRQALAHEVTRKNLVQSQAVQGLFPSNISPDDSESETSRLLDLISSFDCKVICNEPNCHTQNVNAMRERAIAYCCACLSEISGGSTYYFCRTCELDFCETCRVIVPHSHALKHLPLVPQDTQEILNIEKGMGGDLSTLPTLLSQVPISQSPLLPTPSCFPSNGPNGVSPEKLKAIELHMGLLLHTITCVNHCGNANCYGMKVLLLHYLQTCDVKDYNICMECRKARALLQLHAHQCTVDNCPVPHCLNIRHDLRELEIQTTRLLLEQVERKRSQEPIFNPDGELTQLEGGSDGLHTL